MARFRKKPVVIEAVQLPRSPMEMTPEPTPNWMTDAIFSGALSLFTTGRAEIKTLEGVMQAEPGDWIIRGVKGELYPCKPDIFASTYDEVT